MSKTYGTWLHISDLHLKAESYDQHVVLRALIENVKDSNSRDIKPDLIFVSGDIANTGQAAEYQNAKRFFDELLQAANLPKDRLVIVPGNHDVDRTKSIGLARTLSTREEADAYFSPTSSKHHINIAQEAFKDWYNNYFTDKFCVDSSCGQWKVIELGELKVGVLPINTALFSFGDDDQGKLFIGRRALDEALNQANADFDLKIAIMHHPLDWLSETERQNIQKTLREKFDCILAGHLHVSETETRHDNEDSAIFLSAGASYQTRDYPCTAMYVSVIGNQLKIHPIRYEDSPKEKWTLDTSVFHSAKDYFGRFNLPCLSGGIKASNPVQALAKETSETINISSHAETQRSLALKKEFENDLFMSPHGKVLYAEPRIMNIPQELNGLEEIDKEASTIEEIIESKKSYIIEARSEYGGTTLCKRLAFEASQLHNKAVYLADARKLPNYRKKLAIEFKDFSQPKESNRILILDGYDSRRDEKLLKEIRSLELFDRYILLVSNGELRQSNIIYFGDDSIEFIYRYLWTLNRSDVRQFAKTMSESGDSDYISSIVNKVYSDLLDLCIPLTPSNVVMYMRVLFKEEDFRPLNRVDIVERYLGEMLRKPSDLYHDAFTSKNKMDVISAFIFDLYNKELSVFNFSDWQSFCQSHMRKTLTNFDSDRLLNDLIQSRIMVHYDGKISLKYAFFYSYFLGRHIARHPKLLADFTASTNMCLIEGVIEVIAGLSTDNTNIVENLIKRLETALDTFHQKYVDESFDPYKSAHWPDNTQDETFWKSITDEIEKGPCQTNEIDLIKTSLHSELKTGNQKTHFWKLQELEIQIFKTAYFLLEALKNSDDIEGELKKRSVLNFYKTHLIGLQIGAILAPLLAQYRNVIWPGLVSYRDFNQEFEPDDEKQFKQAVHAVLGSLGIAVAMKAGHEIGTRKLGEVFKSLSADNELVGFMGLVNFNCIVISKPSGWFEVLQTIIQKTDKTSFYLNNMLRVLLANYKEEINLGGEREKLKQLIAAIQVKRANSKKVATAKATERMKAKLEKSNYFEDVLSEQTGYKLEEPAE